MPYLFLIILSKAILCGESSGGLYRRILSIFLEFIAREGLQYFEWVKSEGPSRRGVKPLLSASVLRLQLVMHIERLFRFSPGLKSLLYDMLRGLGGVSRPSVS